MMEREQPRATGGSALARLMVHLVLVLAAVLMVMPFLWMISTSLKIDADVFAVPPRWIPTEFDFANYRDAFQAIDMDRLYVTTSIVTGISVITQVLFGAMAGYPFARLRFPGRTILFTALLITMMVPFEVLVLPTFLLARAFPLVGGNDLTGSGGTGLLNSYGGLLLPHLLAVFNIFLFRQFFRGFPNDLEDAAALDGCSRSRFFWTILLPNSKPVIGTVALFSFLWSWNDFLWPLVVARDQNFWTLQVGLATFNQESGTQWAELMAASVIATIPVLLLFLIFQRFLVQGVATSGLKG